jgi:bifunctional UDP-N-acetylglucosamine pyrophosphorylase/glucosamine-1-phosphate N-acetyltransferase
MENAEIRAFSHLEGCIVHSNVTVGPFARIRPNTELHSGSRIGNFVEVKNSIIGENSKANHLAYLGDCNIEQDCNIGAGTIFCNYNGFQKFRSTVGKHSFIGSNSTIISPIEISKGTIVGAGSVITKSTQENSLVIARATQKEIPYGGEKFRKKHKK